MIISFKTLSKLLKYINLVGLKFDTTLNIVMDVCILRADEQSG